MQGYIEELGRDATERSWAMSRRALPPVAFLALMLATLLAPAAPAYPQTPEAAQAKLEQERKEQVRTCHAAGFDTAEDPPAGASPSPDASTAGNNVALPETGGPSLPVPLLAAVAALLATGLLALRGIRR